MKHQLPPDGDWRTWVILGGRGAGKTRAGSEWVRYMMEGPRPLASGRATRMALVADTYDQAREVMIFGDSGILSVTPRDRRPDWVAGRKMLIWPNGSCAQIFTAQDPEGLRGPQFDAAWLDELGKWKSAKDTWEMLQFGLRLGENPRACVTTTPRNVSILKDILSRQSTVNTHATTYENAANLAPSFLEEMDARFGGTTLGRQELEGVVLNDVKGAFWNVDQLNEIQIGEIPDFTRVVVAVDPAVSSGKSADTCGIVVVGAILDGPPQNWKAVVIADASVPTASPMKWANAAVETFHKYNADRLVAEVNQGGEMVETIVRQIDPLVSFGALHASKSKAVRAEPVAALYEQGRVRHAGGLGALEDEMCLMTANGYTGRGSPDRLDALVWALHELMIAPAKRWQNPRMRHL